MKMQMDHMFENNKKLEQQNKDLKFRLELNLGKVDNKRILSI